MNFLVKSLPDLQFTQASADSGLFHYFNSETETFILVASEVDDLIITGKDTEGIERLKVVPWCFRLSSLRRRHARQRAVGRAGRRAQQ